MADKDGDLEQIVRQWKLLYQKMGTDEGHIRPGELLDEALKSTDGEARAVAQNLLQLLTAATIGKAMTHNLN